MLGKWTILSQDVACICSTTWSINEFAMFNYPTKGKHREIQRNQARGTSDTQNQNDKTITWNKETQTTGQHEPLWKPEVKSGASDAAPAIMSPMSY